MKVSLGFNFQEGPWGGGNQFGKGLAKGLQRQGIRVVNHLDDGDIDIILLADPRSETLISAFTHFDILHYLRHKNPRAITAYRVSDCDERKGDVDKFNPIARQAAQAVDVVVWGSRWLRDLHVGQGMQPAHEAYLFNGADQSIFHSAGYQRWDGQEPLKIVTHHWGGVWQKGFDIYQKLDEMLVQDTYRGRIAFTYVGNVPEGFVFKNAQHIPPTSGQELADILRAHHVYVTGSQNEPMGNHHMEAANCGLPILYRLSGALPEYCRDVGIGFEAETFVDALETMFTQYDDLLAKMPDYPYTHNYMISNYLAAFESWLDNRDEIIAQRIWQKAIPTIKDEPHQAGDWLVGLRPRLLSFVESLRRDEQVGRYYLSSQKPDAFGSYIELPFSTWALKTRYILNDDPPAQELEAWRAYLDGFQIAGNPGYLAWGENAFIDPYLLEGIARSIPRKARVFQRLFPPPGLTPLSRMLSAETKQVIATLAQYDMQTRHPYKGFPQSPQRIQNYLQSLDWSKPWQSGAHIATLAVFWQTEAPRFLPDEAQHAVLKQLNAFIESLLDPPTGTYFAGRQPAYDELVNGAMKILTALDWLESPVHAPEKLIDFVLTQHPSSEGCHLVDAIYVLYRCQQQTDYRTDDIEHYIIQLVEMMQAHFNPLDGGFAYYTRPAERAVHGLRVAYQNAASDLHGTLLLTWAGAMILEMLGISDTWRIIKP